MQKKQDSLPVVYLSIRQPSSCISIQRFTVFFFVHEREFLACLSNFFFKMATFHYMHGVVIANITAKPSMALHTKATECLAL